MERIAQQHAGLQSQPEHEPHVAAVLPGAVAEVLGDTATPGILAARGEACWFPAGLGRALAERLLAQAGPGFFDWKG
ncbi:globin family protein [Mangrovicoccus ximenensis]|uniref:hypothetical protein n=1 Tax=Mangrovicoccus ximenensis TaxID=1911570 RepID=UPI000D3926F0|nr:hypothetical protein [Mangrovicoccus ximenensis]